MPGPRILPVGPLELVGDRIEVDVDGHRLAFLLRRGGGGGLGGRGRRRRRRRFPLQRKEHGELGHLALVERRGFHLYQLGSTEPLRRLDVAHQRRDARVRLREAENLHPGAGLLDRFEGHALRRLLHELVEQVHRLRAVGLQRLDDLLPREKCLDLVAQLVDLGDFLVELADLALEERVAPLLHADALGVVAVHEPDDQYAHDGRAAGHDEEVLLRALAPLGAVRQQVDAGHAHCGSNLLIASPHATISEGASTISRLSCTRGEVCIWANGFATLVGTCARVFTTSSSPGITAEPPASRMCSTVWYWVEVKKNCSARWISPDRFSMNGFSTSASKSSGNPPVRFAFSASSGLMP